jgi:hypothetical protein
VGRLAVGDLVGWGGTRKCTRVQSNIKRRRLRRQWRQWRQWCKGERSATKRFSLSGPPIFSDLVLLLPSRRCSLSPSLSHLRSLTFALSPSLSKFVARPVRNLLRAPKARNSSYYQFSRAMPRDYRRFLSSSSPPLLILFGPLYAPSILCFLSSVFFFPRSRDNLEVDLRFLFLFFSFLFFSKLARLRSAL